jgi:muconolactone delta-isomerase
MQFMALFTRHPDKADTPAPADLREAEFETVRGFYADGLVQQIWLRGDAGGACMILQGASIEEVASKLATLPLVHEGFLQPPMIVPLKPYSGFAPRSYPEKRNKGQI